jgi:hypothetical protein
MDNFRQEDLLTCIEMTDTAKLTPTMDLEGLEQKRSNQELT